MLITNNDKTICAISTAPGVGGIAVIRLSGDLAFKITNKIFSRDVEKCASHSATFGKISKNNEVIDEVVVTKFNGPNSFTGEDTIEIACHGSQFIQQEILNLLIKEGCVLAAPGEFTLRSYLNGKMDLSQAEAVADLIHSSSKAAHKMAMHQMRGGFSKDLSELRQKLIDFASLIELELDFGEEDVEFADRDDLKELVEGVLAYINKLTDSFSTGNAIKNGVNTVLAGRPNAGKSTLLNTLLNEERALVSDIAGTTRDTIEELININGVDFRLIDTAGIREASDTIEKMGIEKTLEKINQSSILLYLYDVNETSTEEVEKDISEINSEGNVIIVANKTDKIKDLDSIPNSHIQISALNKNGIETIKNKLSEEFSEQNLDLENTIVSNARHFEALNRAKEDLTKVREGLDIGITGDFLAMDIRQSLHHLGSITGEVTADDLLGNIFSNFCIGK